MQSPELNIKFLSDKIQDGKVFYTMQVYQKNTGQSYSIQVRFSQLREIHKQCQENLPKGELPVFPARTFFSNTSEQFITKRKKELQNYYNTLLKTISISKLKPLKQFLQKNKPKQQKSKQPIINSKPDMARKNSEHNEQPNNPELTAKKKFEDICQQTLSKLIDISNDYFNPPDETTSKRKKAQFEKFKYDLRSPLINQMKLPKGKSQNFEDFWATDYYDEKKQYVDETINKLDSLELNKALNEQHSIEIIHKLN